MRAFSRKPIPAAPRWLLLLSLFFTFPVLAHEPSKSYLHLTLESNRVSGQWDIPLRDLQTVVPLDPDKEGFIAWEKLHARYDAITRYAFAHLQVELDGQAVVLRAVTNEPVVEEFSDGAYLQIPLMATNLLENHTADAVRITDSLFFETNSLHRGLLLLEAFGKKQEGVFDPGHQTQSFASGDISRARQFASFFRDGIWHIWTGYDHILFLLALLLPAVLYREGQRWQPVPALRPAFLNILKIVTAFTLAHSLTLTLATLNVIKIPSRITESAIAASVVLAAANNLRPLVRDRGWIVAFAFGLIHGFGFATALADLGLTAGSLWVTLTAFNLGVETGQLAIVVVVMPIAFALRKSWIYQVPIVRVGSLVIMGIAGLWLAERVGDFKWLPF